MNKKNFLLIIILLAVSLVSILFVQFNWISDLNKLNEDRFKQDIQNVLFMVNDRLEEQEIIALTRDNLQATFKVRRSVESGDFELIESSFNKKTLDSTEVQSTKSSFQYDIEADNSSIKRLSPKINASIQIEDMGDLTLDSSMQDQINKILDRSEMIQIILNKLLTNDRTIKSELDIDFLHNLIKLSLSQMKLDLKYEFIIFNNLDKKIELASSDNLEILNSEFKINLFQNDLIDSDFDLYLFFPNQSQFIRENNFFSMIFSVMFLTVIGLCFYYVILKVFELKKLSEIKNEFIDNMTHELKTPISTISLASEALLDKEIKDDNSRKNYIKIINDENKRLGVQVEKVLSIAQSEKENYNIKFEKISINKIIKDSVDINSFKIKKRSGEIILKLCSDESFIYGNYDHLINVFNNLLDNANKYSTDKPIIKISSTKINNILEVKISDNGIGIKNSNIDKVFDKFYREPQGNIHNVKGFGLGLSYVKNILNKHKATIDVTSKLNHGTKFIINFKSYGRNK
tara:strand:- start:27656 stop:29206 length:1551 start_codon:yes stop_codon:yes gene_type:complete